MLKAKGLIDYEKKKDENIQAKELCLLYRSGMFLFICCFFLMQNKDKLDIFLFSVTMIRTNAERTLVETLIDDIKVSLFLPVRIEALADCVLNSLIRAKIINNWNRILVRICVD